MSYNNISKYLQVYLFVNGHFSQHNLKNKFNYLYSSSYKFNTYLLWNNIENIQKQKIEIIFSTTNRSCLYFSMGNLKEGIHDKISLGNFGLNAVKQVFFHCRTSQYL